MSLIELLITVIVFALVCYVVFWLLGYLNAPEPVKKICMVVIVLIAIIWTLNNFLPTTGQHHFKWW